MSLLAPGLPAVIPATPTTPATGGATRGTMTIWHYCEVILWEDGTAQVRRLGVEADEVHDVQQGRRFIAALGRKGWELVSSVPGPLPLALVHHYFKRPAL